MLGRMLCARYCCVISIAVTFVDVRLPDFDSLGFSDFVIPNDSEESSAPFLSSSCAGQIK